MEISLPINQLYMPDYEAEKIRIDEFIRTFEDPALDNDDAIHNKFKYMRQLQAVANKQSKCVEIAVDDIKDFFSAAKDQGFVNRLLINTTRYVDIISKKIDELMPQPTVNFKEDDLSTFEVIMQQRKFNFQATRQMAISNGMQRAGGEDSNARIPPELERSYTVLIVPGETEKKKIVKMRDIKSHSIGSLVTVNGIVTRATDVRPCMKVAVFACDACGFEVYQVVNSKEFNPQVECPGKKCVQNNVKGQLVLQIKSSKFVAYQEMKIQEPSTQVPIGHVPRTMKITARNDITRQCSAGDIVTITGVYMPQTVFSLRGTGLTQDTYLEAYQIIKEKANYKDTNPSEEMMERVQDVKGTCQDDAQLLSRLSKSICPEIFGMAEVKQALLLLMVSGVTKQMQDGMKIRGTINVLLMGDPGVAKSQLLKHTANFAPRGIYTTGKGSSGVGLTAAVVRDEVTGELLLEGGALVLADTGICCIDEFDKMDERDRTNIHEVMEQQTVSIAKAGITTSLNARTSVLAAANPLYGRYDPKKNPEENINLPAALLSRFDLIFLLLDKADSDMDESLAKHVTQVHRNRKAMLGEEQQRNQVDADVMRAFMSHAQNYDPNIPTQLHNYIVAKYVEKRKMQRDGVDELSYMYVTPRTLLAIIRLAQAMAKLAFRDEVKHADVDAALTLMDFSIKSLRLHTANTPNQRDQERRKQNVDNEMSRVIQRVIEIMDAQGQNKYIPIAEIHKKMRKQFGEGIELPRLMEILEYYQALSLVSLDSENGSVIKV